MYMPVYVSPRKRCLIALHTQLRNHQSHRSAMQSHRILSRICELRVTDALMQCGATDALFHMRLSMLILHTLDKNSPISSLLPFPLGRRGKRKNTTQTGGMAWRHMKTRWGYEGVRQGGRSREDLGRRQRQIWVQRSKGAVGKKRMRDKAGGEGGEEAVEERGREARAATGQRERKAC